MRTDCKISGGAALAAPFSNLPEDILIKLKNSNKPIVMYGTGNGADKMLDICKGHGIEISGVFASDGFVRKRMFRGFDVKSYIQIKEQFGDVVVLVVFGSDKEDVLENIKRISAEQELYIPALPLFGEGLFDSNFVTANIEMLNSVYFMLEDEKSKEVFRDMVFYNISGKPEYLKRTSSADDDYTEILKPVEGEIFVDLGAYRGDTIVEFVRNAPDYNKIIALEPDKKTFEKLKKACEGIINAELYNAAAYSYDTELKFAAKGGRNSLISEEGNTVEARSVDSILAGERASIIKFDVEGAEAEAVKGCEKTIKKYHPSLIVSVYHRNEDIFKLPIMIKEINPEYKFFMRRRRCVPAWDILLYAISK